MLMDLKSMRSPEYCLTVWHVVKNNIWLVGKDMMIMRILGSLLLLCKMLRILSVCMKIVCLLLGSRRPGGGVVLGLERSQHYLHSIASLVMT